MRKRALFIISLFFFIYNVSDAQKQGQQRIDSLVQVIPKMKDDNLKVMVLNRLSQTYIQINTVKASQYASQAMDLAKMLNWKKGIIYSYMTQAGISAGQLDLDKALQYDQTALNLSNEIDDKESKADILGNIALIYSDKSDYPRSLSYLFNALKLKEEIGNKLSIAQTLSNIGNIYYFEKDYDKALEFYLRSVNLKTIIHDKIGIANTFTNIGEIYLEKGNYRVALEYSQKSLDIKKGTGDKLGESENFSNIAMIYLKQHKYADALENINKAIEISESLIAKRDMADQYEILADIYTKIVSDSTESNFPSGFVQRKHLLAKAISNYQKAIAINTKSGNIEKLSQLYQALSEAEYLDGNFKEAVVNYRHSSALKDSIVARENVKLIQGLEGKRIAEIKDKQIEIDQLKLKHATEERIYFIIGFAVLLLLFGILYNRYIIKKRSSEYLHEANNIKSRIFTIISHDLRSPLNSLNAALQLFQSEDIDKETINMITHRLDTSVHATSNLLDNLLTWGRSQMSGTILNQDFVNLNNLTLQVKEIYKYVALQKEISIITDIAPDTIVFGDENIIRLVIRNLIDNAIKFSLPGNKVIISTECNNDLIALKVKDFGIGMDDNQVNSLFKMVHSINPAEGTAKEKGTGLGLSLCYELVKKSGGNLTVESKKAAGTTFTVTFSAVQLPLKQSVPNYLLHYSFFKRFT